MTDIRSPTNLGKRQRSQVDDFSNGTKEATDASLLREEELFMKRKRRELEKNGHRRKARLIDREYRDEQQTANEEGLDNGIMQHPWLDKQIYDGYDPNINPEPPLNTDARREFDNELRLQHQKKLENQQKLTKDTAPKPGFY